MKVNPLICDLDSKLKRIWDLWSPKALSDTMRVIDWIFGFEVNTERL